VETIKADQSSNRVGNLQEQEGKTHEKGGKRTFTLLMGENGAPEGDEDHAEKSYGSLTPGPSSKLQRSVSCEDGGNDKRLVCNTDHKEDRRGGDQGGRRLISTNKQDRIWRTRRTIYARKTRKLFKCEGETAGRRRPITINLTKLKLAFSGRKKKLGPIKKNSEKISFRPEDMRNTRMMCRVREVDRRGEDRR